MIIFFTLTCVSVFFSSLGISSHLDDMNTLYIIAWSIVLFINIANYIKLLILLK